MSSLLFKRVLNSLSRQAPRRSIVTTPVRRSADPLIGHVEQEAQAGASLPFGIQNRYKLAAYFILYFGSGFSAPFLIVRYQLQKKNSA